LYINFTPLYPGVDSFSIGNPPGPDIDCGYIRRFVTVKTPGEFSLNLDDHLDPDATGDRNITIRLDSSQLFDLRKGPVYWTDLMKEGVRFRFNIKNINVVAIPSADGINLSQVSYGYYKPDPESPGSETFVGPIPIVPPLLTEGFTLTGDGTSSPYPLLNIKNNR